MNLASSQSVFISDWRAGGQNSSGDAPSEGNLSACECRRKLRQREHLSNLDEFLLIPYLIGVNRTGRADCYLFNPAVKSKGTSDVGVLEKRAKDGEL